MEDRIIGASALAKILEVDRSTVYRLCDQGMPFQQLANSRIFSKKKVKSWLVKQKSMLQFKL